MTNVLRCPGCHQVAENDWLVVSIDASAGMREGPDGRVFWSAGATSTRHMRICPDCLKRPEWSGLMSLISHRTAERAVRPGHKCIVICREQPPSFLRRLILPKTVLRWPGTGRVSCPRCRQTANSWYADTAPVSVRTLAAEGIPPRRNPLEVAADMWAWLIPEDEPGGPDSYADEDGATLDIGREGP